ncbi:glycosyltransferase [Mangrovimonas sp. DI 80]|uniref:glycosyltransferase n=1 Tax=Mangrovimonas sp. DI 80 TaxID=1779330 RepID=UPI000976EFFC|nr:glycosyltransferase [Mangrovimonas sp. DI 80]OMP30235.1 glycosyl transferase family 1 [Mangrovimonas sp. DI 80]
MKILLIGEYSRLHNSLKEGLEKLGHEVTIVGFGDYFKNYPVDIKLQLNYQQGLSRFFKRVIFKLLKIDLISLDIQSQFDKAKHKFTNFDIVQLINENAFNTIPEVEEKLLDYIFQNNQNVYLLSCGTDYTSINFAINGGFKYSILTPYFEGKEKEKEFVYALKFSKKNYKKLHQFIFKNIRGVIASDLDYHLPLEGHRKYLGMVPNPINTDILKCQQLGITDKIVIFHGINTSKYFKKGNDIFDKALALINEKHRSKIEIVTTKDLPYKDYIRAFNRAHIILDQVFAYDQGYNALEAMAKGKVVFTGAEQEWLDHYGLEKDTVAINALPDPISLAEKLEWLIENPENILTISKNARAFIESEHNYINMAKEYLKKWEEQLV